MDVLGERLERDKRMIDEKINKARELEAEASKLRREAQEIGRLSVLARLS